jgi:predicted transcriptional regulator
MGALERAVLEQLWARDTGAKPGEIRDSLDTEVGYTTITTILARLVQKGQVERERVGRAFRYRAVATEAELAARRMQEALTPTSDRSLVLSRFVDGLSEGDAHALRQILDELDR